MFQTPAPHGPTVTHQLGYREGLPEVVAVVCWPSSLHPLAGKPVAVSALGTRLSPGSLPLESGDVIMKFDGWR